MSTESTLGGPPAQAPPPALLFEDVSKTYPGTRALKRVSVSVEPGEFRALIGENGSGKSTLVGILGGKISADAGGRVEVHGEQLAQQDPSASRAAGIAIIHQELLMVPQLSAMENVFLGDLPRRRGVVAYDRMRDEFTDLAGRLAISISPRAPAGTLSVAQQTMLEIMRAVRQRARILIMDEPTVTLGVPEREKLYSTVAGLREQEVTFLLISHDLDEVLRLADSVTVFREGNHVRTATKAEWTKAKMVSAMLGEQRGAEALEDGRILGDEAALLQTAMVTGKGRQAASGERSSRAPAKPLLTVRGVRAGKVDVAELSAAAGEIVGLAGLVGSGRTSLLRAIAGASKGSVGEMLVDEAPVRWPRSVHEALAHGIALLPEDRKHQGLVLDLPVYDNVTLSDLRKVSSLGILKRARSVARADQLLNSVEFRGRTVGAVRTLSGGNQQKVMVAKWLHRGPRVLLIDEPTRGIDIGAKRDIMRVMEELAAEGHGIVWVSSELEEVVAVSHRVVVLSRGRMVGELTGAEITVGRVLEHIFNAAGDEEATAQVVGEPA